MSKIINKENIKDLEMITDFLKIAIQEEWFEICIPEILSINKTENKFVKDKVNKSFIVTSEIKKSTYDKLNDKETLIFPFVLSKNKD